MNAAIRMTGIDKRFGSVAALQNVDLEVAPQTIHALVGENGAGKTTLMRILYGAETPDAGSIEVGGRAAQFRSSAEAIRAGIGMVSQHYGVIPELTCLENLVLGAEGGALRNVRQAAAKAEALAARMGFHFDWGRDAAELSPAGAQKLEILKLLWREARIMILDEPTAMLSPADSESLFESMGQLVREGATVILVTHRLPEVMEHCSRVTVLRGGRRVADAGVSEVTPRALAELIVGGEMIPRDTERAAIPGPPVLSVEALSAPGPRGAQALHGVDLAVSSGEIVGIAGVDGSGQRELFRTVLGVGKLVGGTIRLDDRDAGKLSAAERYAAGLRLIPEDRHTEGVVEEWSIEENAALGLQRLPEFAAGGLVRQAERRAAAKRFADRFGTRHAGLDQPLASLSGGNQQRFVAARATESGPRLILAFQPARGLDLGATADVYRRLRALCREGAAVLVVSFDLDELLEHCDRVVAMNRGRLMHPSADDPNLRAEIGRLMVGAD